MDIELLYIKGCPNFRDARRLIHDTIKSLCLKTPLKKIEIKNDADAKDHLFPGSPTIRINGNDIEPETPHAASMTCRIYSNGTGLPDRDVLKCKIAKAAGFKTVLFLCTGNAVRSQIAEALVNRFLKDKWAAFSAGIMPMAVNQDVIAVMKEIGIDISDSRAKHVDLFRNCRFDRVITLCSDADRLCISYPVYDEKDRIIFHDPSSSYGFRFGSKKLYGKLRDEIKKIIIEHLKNSRR